MTAKDRVLVVDDEAGVRLGIRDFLSEHGYDVDQADSCRAARARLARTQVDAVVLDYRLPDGDALELLAEIKAELGIPVVILTAYGSIDLAVRAVKEGADQFLTKPVELPTLLLVIQRLIESERNLRKQLAERTTRERVPVDPFAGSSAAIRKLEHRARRALATDSPILIRGETGSGKGVLARWLHDHGPRADRAFVDLNCASLSPEFLDSELFGHEKGAFTGAVATKPGLLEVAHRGTVFLDEIGDMDLKIQPKLLKALEEKRFRRVGSTRDRQVDVRLVVASHHDLEALTRQGRFRSDLYFRISTIPLRVPPLRERIDDIPELARRLLRQLGTELGRGEVQLGKRTEEALSSHDWPGNIRELKNVLERALLFSERGALEPADLRFEATAPTAAAPPATDLTLREVERRHIERVLAEERGRVSSAAKRLGVPRSSLYQKLKTLGITIPR